MTSFLKVPESVMKEKKPFSDVSIALRIAFVAWNWFPVIDDPFDLELRALGDPEGHPEGALGILRDGRRNGCIDKPFILAYFHQFTYRFLYLFLLEKGPFLDGDGGAQVGGLDILVPLDLHPADERLLDDDHREAIPARDLLRVERHVAEIPHPVDRLDVLPDLLQVQFLSDLRPHHLPDGVRRGAARPPHLDRDHPEPVRRHGPGADREEGRAQARQAREGESPLHEAILPSSIRITR